MKLTKEQRRAIENGEDAGPNVNGKSYAISNKVTHRWPNAIIPYNIDCSLGKMDCVSILCTNLSLFLLDFRGKYGDIPLERFLASRDVLS